MSQIVPCVKKKKLHIRLVVHDDQWEHSQCNRPRITSAGDSIAVDRAWLTFASRQPAAGLPFGAEVVRLRVACFSHRRTLVKLHQVPRLGTSNNWRRDSRWRLCGGSGAA